MNKIELKLPAFSLAEALITLLIVCLITLASIPILTKKKRSLTDIKHGAFACYWDGDEIVGKYYIDGKISDATVQYDSEENKNGCVFNPPSNAKNLIATIIGGGGGGASGYYELKKMIVIDKNTGTFSIPADGYYQILLISGGGAGGHTSGGAVDSQIKHNAFDSEPPASSGTPAGLIFTREYLELKKGYTLSYSLGDNAEAKENNDRVGSCGGDSYVEYYKDYNNKQANDYFRLDSQGGGGGSSADYNSGDECYFYHCDPNARSQKGDMCTKAYETTDEVKKGFYKRIAAHTRDCSDSNKKRDRLRSGHSGGTNVEVAGNIRKTSFVEPVDYSVHYHEGHYYQATAGAGEFERFGAFKYEFKNGQWVESEKANGRDASQGRPYRNPALTMDVLQRFNIWELEDQDHPFGSGGYGSGGGKRNHENPKGHGGRAVLSVYWPQVYTGNSGNAGNVIQIPFAQLPQKTLVFPGQGGQGGSSGLPGSAGSPGGSSYIKNYSHALGGLGAPAINSSYYKTSAGKLIMGQNAQLANIQPTSKPMGGAGGFSPKSDNGYIDNNSPDGLTREIFKNGASISFFNNLFGAGAGGGGGSVDVANDNKIGAGGNGSSGIIFIQW